MNTQFQIQQSIRTFKNNLLANMRTQYDFQNKYNFEYIKNFIWKIYPYGEKIGSPLCPIFLANNKDMGVLGDQRVVLAQDGFSSLFPFFLNHSRPSVPDTTFLFKKELSCIVPKTWRGQSFAYNICLDQTKYKEDRLESPSSIYIFSTLIESEVDEQIMRDELGKVLEKYPDKKDKIKLILFQRSDPFTSYPEEPVPHCFKMIRVVHDVLGPDAVLISFKDFQKQKDLSNSVFHYITRDKFTYAFNYLEHYFLSRNCVPIFDRYAKASGKNVTVSLSPFHCVEIVELDEFNEKIWDDVIEIDKMVGFPEDLFNENFFYFSLDLHKKYFT